MIFKEKVLKIVKKIPAGKFLTYKEVAKLAGNEKAFRVVGNILKCNANSCNLLRELMRISSFDANLRKQLPNIPCHRVIKSDYTVGGYMGKKNLDWLKAALLLKEGVIGVIPTDTIYGICTSALNKNSVEKVYKLRKRNPKKPCIILISSISELKLFEIKLKKWQEEILEKIWPARISVVLPCQSKKFSYLHRGTKTLAFRLPKDKFILKILKISGPLIAPSANWEGHQPAETIKEAKKYFENKVFYLNHEPTRTKHKLMRANLPSTLIDLTQKEIKVLRKGADYDKLKNFLKF